MARQFSRGPRSVKEWLSIPAINAGLVAAGTTGGAAVGFNAPATILRMIGEYTIGPTTNTVANDAMTLTVAIGVVSTDAATLGATALPDPFSEPEYPWLYYQSHQLIFPTTSADPRSAQSSLRHGFDIRSMRKVKPRESLVLFAEYTDLGGTPPIQWMVGVTRVLTIVH